MSKRLAAATLALSSFVLCHQVSYPQSYQWKSKVSKDRISQQHRWNRNFQHRWGLAEKDSSIARLPEQLRQRISERANLRRESWIQADPGKQMDLSTKDEAQTLSTGGTYCSSAHEDWSAEYDVGSEASWDSPTAVICDASGNIYVTGFSAGSCATVKYDGSGTQRWVARYETKDHDPSIFDHMESNITLDAAGNVYVTANCMESDGGVSFALLKYDSSGTEQWVAKYRYGKEYDLAYAARVDAIGNIYVIGQSYFNNEDSSSATDIITAKFSAQGEREWVSRYPGEAAVSGAAIDQRGNVYVTGGSQVIKYDHLGVMQWISRYDDLASAIAVDDSFNVYVTGMGTNGYATMKYDSLGTRLWIQGFQGGYATAITLDGLGSVYVTGLATDGSLSHVDLATIKYSSTGAEQWVKRFGGMANNRNPGLAIDRIGGLYVSGLSLDSATGKFYGHTIRYDGSGSQQWAAEREGLYDGSTSLAVDPTGNAYVIGQVNRITDYATVKYSPTGQQQWVASYDGPATSNNQVSKLLVDGAGNCYMTGTSWGSRGDGLPYWDYLTVKYNPAGTREWVSRYSGPGPENSAEAIATDKQGNVFVTGASQGSANYDYATVKYDRQGIQKWVVRYNGFGNGSDQGNAIASDGLGNVYVTGRSSNTLGNSDIVTVKYDSLGHEIWTARYDGPGHGEDEGWAIATDVVGAVYVLGSSWGSGTGYDFSTIKYSSTGVEQWVARYNSPDNGSDSPAAITVDATHNVYVTGSSSAGYVTVKYNPAGIPQWTATCTGSGTYSAWSAAIALDADGSVYVTGTDGNFSADIVTAKYSPSGNEQWAVRYPGSLWRGSVSIAVDGSANVYVAGSTHGGRLTGLDFTAVKYSSLGVQQWDAHFNSRANNDDGLSASGLDSLGNVYLGGTASDGYAADYMLVKYSQTNGYPVNAQWNMVSLPKRPPNSSKLLVFPGAISPLFEYTSAYVAQESLLFGKGYWLKFASAQCNPITGDSVASDTVDVLQGWNLVGSISSPIQATDVTSIPPGLATSKFFGYDRSYFTTEILEPGRAYWVKSSHDGQLILSSALASSSENRIRIVPTLEEPPPPPAGASMGSSRTGIPTEFDLGQNYPNPFNPATTFRYALPSDSKVQLTIYNVLGQMVARPVDGTESAGYHQADWNAAMLSSGVYFYRLEASSVAEPSRAFTNVKKLMLLK